MTSSDAPPAFVLPAALLSQGYALRPEVDDDIPFLMRLYATTREDELAPVPWNEEQKSAFLASQFALQRHHYRTQIVHCRFDVLERGGQPVGRLYLEDRPTRLHIVDIALMPEARSKGLGTAVIEALQAAGRASHRGVGIMVEQFNTGALRFYQRLGFVQVEEHGMHLEMEWLPEQRRAVS